ncbi:hypothetical protein CDV36_006091 [Fusarium kuroshium]|uniref:Uncharacterized protein n=1 Tax=Fusarium kuroshium TaxID=2010991 RepID=A0A3M2S9N0_9HYPO|nr:hypothetical protein CDV36_006091 [Fusarium kuroshium]
MSDKAQRVKKSSSLRDKFQQLESQVQNIYGLLQPALDDGSESSLQALALGGEAESRQDEIQQDSLDTDDADMLDQTPSSQSALIPTSPDVSDKILVDAADIYLKMVHLQPLPLFRPSDLLSYLRSSTRYLVYSFLALCLSPSYAV